MKKRKLEIDPDKELRELDLCSCSLSARGLWSFMRLLMVRSARIGFLTHNNEPVSNDQLARMVGATPAETSAGLDELQKAGIVELERGVFISRKMILEEKVRLSRAAGGKLGGNKALKPPKQVKVILQVEEKVNLPIDDKKQPERITIEDKPKVNLTTSKAHESKEKTKPIEQEVKPTPLYIIFKIDSLINEKEDIEGVWGRKTFNTKLRHSVLNEIDNKEVRDFLSNDADLIQSFLCYEHARANIFKPKKPMSARSARDVILEAKKLSDGDKKLASKLILQAESRNWLGIYPLKNEEANKENKFSRSGGTEINRNAGESGSAQRGVDSF